MKNLNKLIFTFFFLSIALIGCETTETVEEVIENEDEETVEDELSARVLLSLDLEAQGLYPLHVVDDAESGSADIEEAQELMKSDGAVLVTNKDGYTYVNDYTGETFKKLKVNDEGVLEDMGEIPNLGTNGNPLFTFLDDNRILLTSKQLWPVDGVYSYQIINVSTMSEETSGTITLPINADADAGYSYMWANNYVFFEGKVYIPYVEAGESDGAIYDEAQVAVYNAETMEYEKKITSSKTASVCNGFNPSYGVSESGDLYLCSSNTALYAGNESVPSGIVRIKAGTSEFDDSYFLDITEATGFHTLGMQYLGNNKAIVQVFNSDVWDNSDYYVEYVLVDLETKSVESLDIPASRGGYYGARRSMGLLANGKGVILTNHEDGNSLYIYEPSTGKVFEGLNYTGAEAIVGLKTY
ncbi:DUF4374 domain-containing protein [Flammeovirga sp. SubArs3]|uniref:DUF4374 domain-containing protein n=1 Tax=Flammeovirga sp. SubArs3 TaxID=2995316 RepID=UPI00248AFE38|nr:DUF4374 domain-containing protein [Flammeovirga sp. SubArs3]